MREHRALVQQAGAAIDVEVAARIGEQLGAPIAPRRGSRPRGSACTAPGTARSRRPAIASCAGAAGRREAQRHRVGEAAAAVPARDQLEAVALGAGARRRAGRRGAWRSISTLPAISRMSRSQRRVEQRVDRRLVHRREHHRSGRAVGEQAVDEAAARRLRAAAASAWRALGREGVGVEPVEQLGAVAGDHVELRAVHMGVDEAGHHQPAAVVERSSTIASGTSRCAAGDAAVLDQQPVVGVEAHRAGVSTESKPGRRRSRAGRRGSRGACFIQLVPRVLRRGKLCVAERARHVASPARAASAAPTTRGSGRATAGSRSAAGTATGQRTIASGSVSV